MSSPRTVGQRREVPALVRTVGLGAIGFYRTRIAEQ